MHVASRSAVQESVGVIKTRLDNRCGDSGSHGVSECRSDVSESPGVEVNVSTKRLCVCVCVELSCMQPYLFTIAQLKQLPKLFDLIVKQNSKCVCLTINSFQKP